MCESGGTDFIIMSESRKFRESRLSRKEKA